MILFDLPALELGSVHDDAFITPLDAGAVRHANSRNSHQTCVDSSLATLELHELAGNGYDESMDGVADARYLLLLVETCLTKESHVEEVIINGVVAVAAALAGGAVGSYFNRPSALIAAEEKKIKMQGRRQVLSHAREMLERAARMGWSDGANTADAAGQALLAAAGEEARTLASCSPIAHGVQNVGGSSTLWRALSSEVPRLEREWKLV